MAQYNDAAYTYSSPIRYDGVVTTSQSLSVRGRISIVSAQSIQLRAYLIPGSQSFTGRGRISPTFTSRSRISRQQGWPIPDTVNPAYAGFTPTQLYIKGCIVQASQTSKTLSTGAYIFKGNTFQLSLRGRVVLNSTCQMRAHILPRRFTSTASMTYSVSRASRNAASMLFYIQGNENNQSLSMGAHIVQPRTSTFAGYFIVVGLQGTSKVVAIPPPSLGAATQQTMTVRAAVSRP